MPWKLGLAVFAAAALVAMLGPMVVYVIGSLIAIAIVGLLLTLTVLGLFGRRGRSREREGRPGSATGVSESTPAGSARDGVPPR